VVAGLFKAEWPLQDNWQGTKGLLGNVTVPIPGAYTNQDYFAMLWGRFTGAWGKVEQPSLTLRCVFSWEGELSATVSMSVWKDRAKLICVWTGWCVYAVTLPLIQLSKLLSVVRDWQGFHSTVLDTQTHHSLSVSACMHKSSFYASEFYRVSLSLCLCVPAVWMLSCCLQLLALIHTGVDLYE